MNCPYCGKEMKHSCLCGRWPLFSSGKEERLMLLPGRGDVMLVGAFAVSKPPAYLCEDCKTVITTYE